MSGYIIYGKRPNQKRFSALDAEGCQVHYLGFAMVYATKEDAQRIIDLAGKDDCVFEIRSVPKEKKTMSIKELHDG